MPRSARRAIGGEVYHVLNRAALRYRVFRTDKDYAALERLIGQGQDRVPGVRVLAWCVMSNHWRLLLWPTRDGELSEFMAWLTMTHAARYRTSHHNVGYGPVYQGRYKSFVVERDEHLVAVARYIERNALRAEMVKRAEDWRWGSLWVRQNGTADEKRMLHDWPIDIPANWITRVNQAQTAREESEIEISIERSRPLGNAAWQQRMAETLGLTSCFRNPGRPATEKPRKS